MICTLEYIRQLLLKQVFLGKSDLRDGGLRKLGGFVPIFLSVGTTNIGTMFDQTLLLFSCLKSDCVSGYFLAGWVDRQTNGQTDG